MFRILDFLVHLPVTIFRNISDIFEYLFVLIRDIGESSEDDLQPKRSWWFTALLLPLLLPLWILKFILRILSMPFSVGFFSPERLSHLLWGLPAVIAFMLTSTAVIYTILKHDSIVNRYKGKMQEAINEKDFKLASVLGGRLVSESSKPDPQLTLNYAFVLSQSGESQRAIAMINDLAPEDKSGFAPAHLLRARNYVAMLSKKQDGEMLNKLQWHLQNAGNSNAEQTEPLWAFYYHTIGQDEEAAIRLENAAKINPANYLDLAQLYAKSNNQAGVDRVLKTARDAFSVELKQNPLNRNARLKLAVVLAKQLRADDAEQVMLQGLNLHRDAEMRRAMAEFYLLRYDVGKSENLNLTKRLGYLQRALKLDLGYLPTYDRLVQFYSENSKDDHGREVISLLEEMIADGNNTALAHFALSSIFIVDQKIEAAQIHLRQAFLLDNQIPIVCNNLAWLLAVANPPKLEEALALAEQAVKVDPERPNFRDTLGTIYMKLDRNQEAITELEMVLPKVETKKEVHLKLAVLYERVGQKNLATIHAEKAAALDKP